MGLGVQPAVSGNQTGAVQRDFAEEPPPALPGHSEVVYTPFKLAAGRGLGEEQYPFGCSPWFEAFGAELCLRCGIRHSVGLVSGRAEPGFALPWGRAACGLREGLSCHGGEVLGVRDLLSL